jgi:hypothetical protein
VTATPRVGAVLLAWALAVYAALGGLPLQVANELHLIWGLHYQYDFFGLVTPRFDQGQSVTVLAPLTHTLLGLIARIPYLGLERGWAVLCSLVPPLLVLGLAELIEELTDDAEAGSLAAFFVAASPLVFVFTYPFGQMPFMAAAALALFAGGKWTAALRTSSLGPHLSGALFACAALCAHPAAVALLVAVCAVALALRHPSASVSGKAGAVVSLLAAVAGASYILSPLGELETVWLGAASESLGSMGSTANAVGMGAVVALVVIVLVVGDVRGRTLALAAAALAGLGVTHRLTGLAHEKWLVSALLLALSAWAVTVNRQAGVARARAWLITVVALGVPTAWALGRSWDSDDGRHFRALGEVAAALNDEQLAGRRYITLGLRGARFELARRVALASLDTGFSWVQASALRGSPFRSIDALPALDSEARQQLVAVLARAKEEHLGAVVSTESRWAPALEAAGFRLRSAWSLGLTLWVRGDVEPAPVAVVARQTSYRWAFASLLTLVLAVALKSQRWRRSDASGARVRAQ